MVLSIIYIKCSQPEINQHHFISLSHPVIGLDIAMHHEPPMNVFQDSNGRPHE
jgi:hypothetical protein